VLERWGCIVVVVASWIDIVVIVIGLPILATLPTRAVEGRDV
jgi:hypothetical protein